MHEPTPHILFSGGVTGGHLFPGLAVAEQLQTLCPNVRITFSGAGRVLDRQQVFQAGHDYVGIPCHPTPRRLSEIRRFLTRNRQGTQKAAQYIQDNQVSAVVGLGGYASVPTARAASRCDVPLVLLEQNVVPGRATRWLARSADTILLSIKDTAEALRTRAELHVTGNPVRRQFVENANTRDTDRPHRRLLILGGSNGAGELNTQMPLALYRCRQALGDWKVVHQTGVAQHADTELLYHKLNLPAEVVPFVDDMAETLQGTDLVISRAGGTTLSELAVSGVPAILCPLAKATDDHQRRNAEYYRRRRAAIVIEGASKTNRFDTLVATELAPLLTDKSARTSLASAIAALAQPQAAARVAERILRLVRPTSNVPAPLGRAFSNSAQARL